MCTTRLCCFTKKKVQLVENKGESGSAEESPFFMEIVTRMDKVRERYTDEKEHKVKNGGVGEDKWIAEIEVHSMKV